MNDEFRSYVNEHMPFIDKMLAEEGIPVHSRLFVAGRMFVEIAIGGSSFNSKEELLKSGAYIECMLPIFNDWYFERYGDLIRAPENYTYSGVVGIYDRPVMLKIPGTTSTLLEPGRLARMKFSDHMEESESVEDLLESKFDLSKMEFSDRESLRADVEEVVALTRSINIDLNTASNLNEKTKLLAKSIWSHFEKAVADIASMDKSLSSLACWDIHLAIEKSLKVFISQKSGKLEFGHDLQKLSSNAKSFDSSFDYSLVQNLPSDKDAIKLRYAEEIRTHRDAIRYYMIGLRLVSQIALRLDHNIRIKNASIDLRKAPWAI